jgi:phosphatidylglycerophosphatase A
MTARPDAQPPVEPGGRKAPFLARFIATGAYSGYAPWASGTVGTAVGLLVYLLPGVSSPPVLSALITLMFFTGRWAAHRVAVADGHALQSSAAAAKRLFQPGPALHPDPSIVVIDEIVGLWVALLFLPKEIPALLVAFTTFRLFDIVKPPPVAALERAGRGWGIMLDDVAAGIYANAVTHVTLWLIG